MSIEVINRQAAIANAISGRTREIDGEKWIRVSEVRESIKTLPPAERHEHITSEKDETFRIASEIRLAVGCNTAQECWELARKGDIKRIRHGKWIDPEDLTCYKCSVCGEYATQEYGLTEPIFWRYCPNCGSRMMDEEE